MRRTTRLMLVLAMITALVPLAAGSASAERVFIRADQAAELVGAPGVRFVDCRRDDAQYAKAHVPGAVFMNVNKALRTTGAWEVPGVRRDLEELEELFGRDLGIGNNTTVLLYDDEGYDATRLFWELKYVGHDKVALIFGGWPEWTAQNLPVDNKTVGVEPRNFVGTIQPDLLATASYIVQNLGNPNVILVDCRPPAQYKGDAKAPMAKVGGRIPTAVNAFTLANWEDKTYLKDPNELGDMYADMGITKDKEVICYCNTGYYASNTFFILKALDYPNVRVYDYSWAEWSGKAFLPKIEGTAK